LAENERLQRELVQLQSTLQTTQTELKHVTDKLSHTGSALQALKEEHSATSDKLSRTADALTTATAEHDRQQTRAQQLAERISALQQEIGARDHRSKTQLTTITELNSQRDALQRQLEELHAHHTELTDELRVCWSGWGWVLVLRRPLRYSNAQVLMWFCGVCVFCAVLSRRRTCVCRCWSGWKRTSSAWRQSAPKSKSARPNSPLCTPPAKNSWKRRSTASSLLFLFFLLWSFGYSFV
jgi:hypothetical protein